MKAQKQVKTSKAKNIPKKKKKAGTVKKVLDGAVKAASFAAEFLPVFSSLFASPAHAAQALPRAGPLPLTALKTSRSVMSAPSAPLALGGTFDFSSMLKSRQVTSRMDPLYGETLRIRGMDYLASISVSNGSPPPSGSVLYRTGLNPATWNGTRVAEFSNMYEMFRIHSMAFIYEPSASATTPGSLVVYVDPDPADNAGAIVGSIQSRLVSAAMSSPMSVMTQVWEMGYVQYRQRKDQTDLYCDQSQSDIRLSSGGTLFILAPNDFLNAGGGVTPLGNILVYYDIEFMRPQVDDTGTNGQAIAETVTPTAANLLAGATLDPASTLDVEVDYVPAVSRTAVFLPEVQTENGAGENPVYLLLLVAAGTTLVGPVVASYASDSGSVPSGTVIATTNQGTLQTWAALVTVGTDTVNGRVSFNITSAATLTSAKVYITSWMPLLTQIPTLSTLAAEVAEMRRRLDYAVEDRDHEQAELQVIEREVRRLKEHEKCSPVPARSLPARV